ncbi:MAG TPA: BMP family ABC transporter substrate-binding protein [Pseudolysinimonas sp.]|nr:BMP family ABC transporter substrate-binding protein [Pseudolysinimonas sp.]
MTFVTRRAGIAGLALIGASSLILVGCAPAPDSNNGGTKSDFLPCMVSDSGGFDDKSFNELGYDGLVAASKEIGVKPRAVESASDADYADNIQTLIDADCDLIVTVGFNLSAATISAAKANPKVNFAIIDDAADADFDGKTDAPNIKPILFDTAQAAFLAGYAASSYTKTGTLGTFAGIAFPTVTIFMDGFYQGMTYYNEQKGKSVKLVGYDPANVGATLATGDFKADDNAKSVAKTVIEQGADVILPVGGPIFQSAGAAIEENGGDLVMLGVDADVYDTFPKYDDLYFTSILKDMKTAVSDVVGSAAKGDFDVTPYVGTLENGGVGIAPFHKYKDKVDPGLADELDAIKAQIISGDIKVTSYLSK